jgi:IS5 family transposase
MEGNTHAASKLVSAFEPTTEVIRKGKAGKPNEFGKLAKIQEAENQIVTHYEVYDHRPNELVAADAGFYSAANETAAEQMGVRRVAIPNRATKSEARKRRQKPRWFKKAMKWCTGCEGRISVLKHRHGLIRCRCTGAGGIRRWIGLDVIADKPGSS